MSYKYLEPRLPKPLSNEEFKYYFEKMKNGDKKAREKIIKHNMRLVLTEVYRSFNNTTCDKCDLVSAGFVGLVRSVDSFDISKNVQFSTYAAILIRTEIIRVLRKEKKYNNNCGLEEFSCYDDEGGELFYQDTICDDFNFVDNYEVPELYKIINQIIDSLPETDGQVVKYYFGFPNNRPMSQEEIGDIYGISRYKVSKILVRSLRKISAILKRLGLIDCEFKPYVISMSNGPRKPI